MVALKGKAKITWWEEELKEKSKGKEWDDMVLEAD
jgi:hypothetical protein